MPPSPTPAVLRRRPPVQDWRDMRPAWVLQSYLPVCVIPAHWQHSLAQSQEVMWYLQGVKAEIVEGSITYS